MQPNIQG